MIEAANILYLVLRLIKIQVSWSVSWSGFELIEYVLIGMFKATKRQSGALNQTADLVTIIFYNDRRAIVCHNPTVWLVGEFSSY